MTVTVASFRGNLTEFTDAARYPDPMVQYWLDFATLAVANATRWGRLLDRGIESFMAHHIVLERRAMDEALLGKPPGMTPGIVNNKSVDKVSVGYDTQSGAELDAGHWNLTIYGTRYIRLVRIIGAGPLQVGTGCSTADLPWPGPWQSNFPNPSG